MISEQCKGVHCIDLGESFQNAYLLPKVGFDTAENEPWKVCRGPAAKPARPRSPNLFTVTASGRRGSFRARALPSQVRCAAQYVATSDGTFFVLGGKNESPAGGLNNPPSLLQNFKCEHVAFQIFRYIQ